MNDNQEILTGSNPLNPDEDGDGNRDYLTPELSNPEGIVVSTLREASAVFVFDKSLVLGISGFPFYLTLLGSIAIF